MPCKPYQSCLVPHTGEIVALRRRRPPVPYSQIADLLKEKYQLAERRDAVCFWGSAMTPRPRNTDTTDTHQKRINDATGAVCLWKRGFAKVSLMNGSLRRRLLKTDAIAVHLLFAFRPPFIRSGSARRRRGKETTGRNGAP